MSEQDKSAFDFFFMLYPVPANEAVKLIESRDAAQRQAGRGEAEKRYAKLVEAARKAVKEFDLWVLVEALRELDEGRKG